MSEREGFEKDVLMAELQPALTLYFSLDSTKPITLPHFARTPAVRHYPPVVVSLVKLCRHIIELLRAGCLACRQARVARRARFAHVLFAPELPVSLSKWSLVGRQ